MQKAKEGPQAHAENPSFGALSKRWLKKWEEQSEQPRLRSLKPGCHQQKRGTHSKDYRVVHSRMCEKGIRMVLMLIHCRGSQL